jgi:hypothetical protein
MIRFAFGVRDDSLQLHSVLAARLAQGRALFFSVEPHRVASSLLNSSGGVGLDLFNVTQLKPDSPLPKVIREEKSGPDLSFDSLD